MNKEDKEWAVKSKAIVEAIENTCNPLPAEIRLTIAANLLYSYIKQENIEDIKDFMKFLTNGISVKMENRNANFQITEGNGDNTNIELIYD